MSNWKNSSLTEAENTPDAKSFVFRRVSQTASPFSAGSTITLHSSPARALQNVFSQSAFCWADNIEECLAYLSKELIALGLPSLFTDDSFEESPASGFNLVALINCTHYLLQLHWKNMAKVDELESARFKSFSEQDCMRSSQFKLQEQAETLEREITALQAKDQQAQKNIRNLNSLLKSTKEEVVKLQNIISSRSAQHAHDMKRKEQELSKLKEKMHHHLTDKKDKRMSIDILNQIGRSDGRRSLWRTGKTESRREGEMYKVLTGNYETQLKDLALDNAELKRALNRVNREMSEFPSSQEKLRRQGSLQSLVQEEEDTLDESHDADRKHLTDVFLKQWTSLKDHLQKLQMAGAHKSPASREDGHAVSVTDHDKEMAKLKLELEQSKQIIREQQQVLQDQLAIEKDDLAQGPDLLEEMEWFNKERQLFEEQRANFKTERESFTEAAIRLGRERNVFESERAQLRKEQFFNLTPFRERRAKPRLRLRTACTMASPDRESSSALLAGHKMGRWTIHSHRPLGTLSPPPKGAQPRGASSRRYSLPASHELCHALGVIPERSFRIAPTARLRRSYSPTRQQESSTQTRNDSGWMSAALFMNESDDSLYIGPLHSRF
ncbi:afadin- and alpha-actinin-binding protein-like isoform X1 [Leucoraja erinacea]|uniref:afadin- and alpha-actinin-binding protein-like isoform X1 n=1 Tax=Leucoraja erinaceus TaxID=7782 RepID=UPI002455ABFA|nr:afadin- and alpha-actinin-binding protein-like isoform X1 [Leucoraja erinacea]